jgi:hypothetical protein
MMSFIRSTLVVGARFGAISPGSGARTNHGALAVDVIHD